MKKLIPILSLLIPCLGLADSQVIGGQWRGLHNADASITIDDNEAQSLQDVDITPGGTAIKKRSGYATFRTIGTSTWPVRGGYFFRDIAGVDTLVFANNRSIFKSANSGAFTAFVTTDTAGSYYDFTDSQGYLWRANSNRDEIVKWDGTTTTYYPSSPKGNQVEVSADRLIISGTSANPNRINFSASANFSDFASGLLDTSAFTEDIGLPGQSVNAIKVACGGVLAWTKDSLSLITAQTQFDLSPTIQISNTVGTLQPNTVINDQGLITWQGQDNHFYSYDCNVVRKISEKLDVSGFASGSAKNWTQTTQADFAAGTLAQTSSSLVPASVVLSTWTGTQATNAAFAAGSTSNTTVIGNSVYLSTTNDNPLNNSFENGTGTDADNWSGEVAANFTRVTTFAHTGSASMKGGTGGTLYFFYVLDTSLNVIDSTGVTISPSNVWAQKTYSNSSLAGRFVSFAFLCGGTQKLYITAPILYSGGAVSWYDYHDSGLNRPFIDDITGGNSTILSGTFTSSAFDTGFSTAVFSGGSVTASSNSHSITYQTQNSTDNVTWQTAQTWTPAVVPTTNNYRYLRYVVTMSTGGTTNGTALPHVDSVSFQAKAATGTIISQDENIGANATSFGSFSVSDTLNNGTITYEIRTATSAAMLSSASWVTVTDQNLITATINPWLNVRASFSTTLYTSTPTLSDFTVNWNEGTIVRSHGITDKFHRLLWTVGEGSNTTPSATYIYDPRFNTWLKYSIPLDVPAKYGDTIYFGSTTSGTVFNYPSGDTDSGSAITAFWKSKDFISPDPFVEKNFSHYSIVMKSQTGSNLDVTYTLNGGSSGTSANYSLTESAGNIIKRINTNISSGTFGSFINFKFGNDDGDAPFEIYAFGYDATVKPWRVMQ